MSLLHMKYGVHKRRSSDEETTSGSNRMKYASKLFRLIIDEANDDIDQNNRSSHFNGASEGIGIDDLSENGQNINEKVNENSDRRNSNINMLESLIGAFKIAKREIRNQEEAALVAVCDNIERNTNERLHTEKIFRSSVSPTDDAWSKKHLLTKVEPKLDTRPLNHDIYSILFVAKNQSYPILYALGVVALQATTISVFLVDIIPQFNKEGTMPVNVNFLVRIAQCLTILLMVTTQDDVIQGVCSLYNGYSSRILNIAPFATKRKFIFVYGLQTIIGFTYQLAIFTLIIKGDDIVSILLNFAALSFVAIIDDIAFMIAANYLVTDELGVLAQQIVRTDIPIPVKFPSQASPVSSYRSINFMFLLSFYYVFYFYVVVNQMEGFYACNTLLVQFGDQVDYQLGLFSGVYERRRFIGSPCYLINDRFVYFRHDEDNLDIKALFVYCQELEIWTFHNITSWHTDCEEINPCENYWAKSNVVRGYNIMDAANSKWSISAGTILDHFYLQCNDLEGCHNNGKMNETSGRCICNEGDYGVNCEFSGKILCKSLYRSFENSEDTIPFSIMTNSTIKQFAHRPLFSREIMIEGSTNKTFELILYEGVRWIYYTTAFIKVSDPPILINSVEELMTKALSLDAIPVSFTEPIYYKTFLDTGTPKMVNWIKYIHSKVERLQSYNINKLVCGECDPKQKTNACQNEGKCEQHKNETFHRCTCPRNFRGYTCEEYIDLN